MKEKTQTYDPSSLNDRKAIFKVISSEIKDNKKIKDYHDFVIDSFSNKSSYEQAIPPAGIKTRISEKINVSSILQAVQRDIPPSEDIIIDAEALEAEFAELMGDSDL